MRVQRICHAFSTGARSGVRKDSSYEEAPALARAYLRDFEDLRPEVAISMPEIDFWRSLDEAKTVEEGDEGPNE